MLPCDSSMKYILVKTTLRADRTFSYFPRLNLSIALGLGKGQNWLMVAHQLVSAYKKTVNFSRESDEDHGSIFDQGAACGDSVRFGRSRGFGELIHQVGGILRTPRIGVFRHGSRTRLVSVDADDRIQTGTLAR